MKKIYIVDDDRNIVDSISMVLKSSGYMVGAQHDEHNVVENASRFGADLIVLDVMFPENETSGFELAREIKNSEKTKDVPILMLSAINEKRIYPGSFSRKDRDGSLLPVDDFVEKPVSPSALLKKVTELLSAR